MKNVGYICRYLSCFLKSILDNPESITAYQFLDVNHDLDSTPIAIHILRCTCNHTHVTIRMWPQTNFPPKMFLFCQEIKRKCPEITANKPEVTEISGNGTIVTGSELKMSRN